MGYVGVRARSGQIGLRHQRRRLYTDPSYRGAGDASGPADIPSGESAAAIRGLGKIAGLGRVTYCGSQVRMAVQRRQQRHRT